MSPSFPKRKRKNSSIDIGGSYWQRFEKKKRFKFKFFLLVFKLMIYHGNENQQSFHTDSSPVVFLEPLQCRARCDGKVEHLVMTRALNLVRNLQCGRRSQLVCGIYVRKWTFAWWKLKYSWIIRLHFCCARQIDHNSHFVLICWGTCAIHPRVFEVAARFICSSVT